MNNSSRLSDFNSKKFNMTKFLQSVENLDKLLVIIPCYNEEKNIEKTMNKLLNVANFHYLIVNDCSTDNTLEIIKKNNWNYISNKENLKLSKTFQEGIKYALRKNYKYVVQYDGDGQHEPLTILEMFYYIQKGYDIVTTSRYLSSNKNHNKLKKTAHSILTKLFYISTHQKITDPTCGLRMFNWQAIEYFSLKDKLEPEPWTLAFFIKKEKMKLKEIPTIIYDRANGQSIFKSKWKIFKYMSNQCFRIIFLPRKI